LANPPVFPGGSSPRPALPQPRIDITLANRETQLAQMLPQSVALTFDDGPDPTYTPQVLAKLRQYQIKATFFLVGMRVQQHCPMVQQIVAEGHELGNHSFTHPRLPELPLATQAQEIQQTQQAIQQCVGVAHLPRWFRAPYGRQNRDTFVALQQLGLSSALWSMDTRDWNQETSSQMIAEQIRQTQGQEIVVMHDGLEANPKYRHPASATTRAATIGSLDLFLADLQAKRLRFVTLSQAFAAPKPDPVGRLP
jgi:peptidoglycan-N-acetylglucosamine deacetylase